MRDFAIVASNKFKVSSTKVNGIKINNYYYAGKSAKIYNQLAKQTAVDSIKLFTKKYGPYPYSELDLTESPFGSDTGGMEYSGLVMIAQDTFARKKAASSYFLGILLIGDKSKIISSENSAIPSSSQGSVYSSLPTVLKNH